MPTLDDVADAATGLPETFEGERRGTRTWSVSSKAFAWERPFTKADLRRFGTATPPSGQILAVRVADLDEKDLVLATNPDSFFTIPHFAGFSAVLVRLNSVSPDALQHAIVEAWLATAPSRLTRQFLAASGPDAVSAHGSSTVPRR